MASPSGTSPGTHTKTTRAPIGLANENLKDDNIYLRAVSMTDLSTQQRTDEGLRPLIKHLEGCNASVPQWIAHGLSYRTGRLVNLAAGNKAYVLVVPAELRDERMSPAT